MMLRRELQLLREHFERAVDWLAQTRSMDRADAEGIVVRVLWDRAWSVPAEGRVRDVARR